MERDFNIGLCSFPDDKMHEKYAMYGFKLIISNSNNSSQDRISKFEFFDNNNNLFNNYFNNNEFLLTPIIKKKAKNSKKSLHFSKDLSHNNTNFNAPPIYFLIKRVGWKILIKVKRKKFLHKTNRALNFELFNFLKLIRPLSRRNTKFGRFCFKIFRFYSCRSKCLENKPFLEIHEEVLRDFCLLLGDDIPASSLRC